MIFFSFAFIPSSRRGARPYQGVAAYSPGRGRRRVPRRWGSAARGANSGYKRAWRGAAGGRGRVGGPGHVGRAAAGRGGNPLSLIKLYEYAILLSRFLPPSSLLLVMFLSCL